jgi:hypothetical protein
MEANQSGFPRRTGRFRFEDSEGRIPLAAEGYYAYASYLAGQDFDHHFGGDSLADIDQRIT